MQAIMLSTTAEWVAKILNHEKYWEIRKLFPRDYVGWVYLYCTKDTKRGYLQRSDVPNYIADVLKVKYVLWDKSCVSNKKPVLNGKVVARFWCSRVATIRRYTEAERTKDDFSYCFDYWAEKPMPEGSMDIQQGSCLLFSQLNKYAGKRKELRAISITQLEVFDKPKEIGEFKVAYKYKQFFYDGEYEEEDLKLLTKAPQSWCWIEI